MSKLLFENEMVKLAQACATSTTTWYRKSKDGATLTSAERLNEMCHMRLPWSAKGACKLVGPSDRLLKSL
jgi:hypothetical protein